MVNLADYLIREKEATSTMKATPLLIALLFLTLRLAAQPAAKTKPLTCQITNPTNQPVPYVNVYLPSAKTGVLSDETGSFKLATEGFSDTTRAHFSCLGYATTRVTVGELRQRAVASNCQVELTEAAFTTPLVEVSGEAIELRQKTLGVPPPGRFRRSGYNASGNGVEYGTVIQNKSTCRVDELRVFVSNVNVDSFHVEMKIYDYQNGYPGPQLQHQRLFMTILREDNNQLFSVPVIDQQLYVNGDFLLTTTMLEAEEDAVIMLENTPKKKFLGLRHRSDGTWTTVSAFAPSVSAVVSCMK